MRQFISLIIISSVILMYSSCTETSAKWQKYTAKDGTFSINMPANYKVSDTLIPTIFGRQVVHSVSWRPSVFALDKFKLFQVTYTDCPKGFESDTIALNSILDSSIDERKRDLEVAVTSEPVIICGYRGRAFIYDPPSDNVLTVVKQCVVNNRLYDITVIAKRNYPTNVELGNFFNSFQLLR